MVGKCDPGRLGGTESVKTLYGLKGVFLPGLKGRQLASIGNNLL